MAETQTPKKRTRDACLPGADFDGSKRQKPVDMMLEEEADPSQDRNSAIFGTFQNEISSASPSEDNEDLKLSIMRYLFEASDDELGIPNRSTSPDEMKTESAALNYELDVNDDGLWELEDDAANYYALMQSQLFMECTKY